MKAMRKLYMCILFQAAMTLVLALFAIWLVRDLNLTFDTAVNKSARKLQLGADINTIKSDMYVAQRGSVLSTFMKDPAHASSLRKDFEALSAKMQGKFETLQPLMSNAEGKRLLANIKGNFEQWQREYQVVVRLCEAGDPTAAQQHSFDKIAPVYKALGDAATQFEEVYRQELVKDSEYAAASYSRSLWIIAVLLLVNGIAIGPSLYMSVKLGKELRTTAAELSQGAMQVASAASQVSSSSQSLAQGASEQAASLQETSSSSEEITSMTRKNADNAKTSANLMTEMTSQVAEGNHKLGEMITSMNEINASSEKISKIIKTIDEIAFQTNILALNAAVEAARAGEAGMGFAVVADEVRNLAQRCAQAAKDTASLIEESVAKSQEGGRKLDEVAKAIVGITGNAEKVKVLVDEVSVGSEEQARGLEQISKSVSQMEQVTQKSAATAEESAAAGEELTSQSESLRGVANRLAGLVGAVSS